MKFFLGTIAAALMAGPGLIAPLAASAAPTEPVVIYREAYASRVQTDHGTEFYRMAWADLNEGGYLRVRTGPGTGYEEIGFLKQYDMMHVIAESDGWYLMYSQEDADYGWVYGAKVTLFPPGYYGGYYGGHYGH